MKETVEGIILQETDYSETSKILNILTGKYGLISVISKGSRTLKSRLRGISMKLVYGEFTITYKEKGLSNLIEGCIVDSLKNIMTNFNKMKYANRLVRITQNVLKDNNNPKLFSLLRDSLLKINEGLSEEIITIIFETKLLSFLGVEPDFSECIMCGAKNIKTFDLKIPGIVCCNCYHDTYLFSSKTLKLLSLFTNVDIKKIDKLNISLKIKEELLFFLKEYYESYTGIFLEDYKK